MAARPSMAAQSYHGHGAHEGLEPTKGGRVTAELSYASGTSDVPLLGETIGANFERTVARVGESEALVDCASVRRWTYEQLNGEVDQFARALLAGGIEKGDRVGIWSTNCAEWVIVQYATAKIGAILVNVNPAYRAHELAYVLNQSGVSLLVTAGRTARSDFPGIVGSVRGECPDLRALVVIGTDSWQALVDSGQAVPHTELVERATTLAFDDPINIQYTSGTTGFPKGATLSHHNILNNGYFVGELLSYNEHDRICLPVPFYHCFGMVMGNLGATSHGSCIVIPAPSFDPVATLDAVSAERCTSLYGVPTMFIAELNEPRLASLDLSSLRTGVMAGSPCPIEVMKRVISEMNMSEVAICYGMTETSPVSTQTRVDDDLDRRTATVGRVMPHLEVKVVDPVAGTPLPRGEPGELCTRGYSVMLGYWANADATTDAIDTARWMHTGDLAVMRDDGYVNIVGRIKDMVIRGGENVYPREIEEFLYGHPDIVDVQVVGVPDERYGEELCAWIRLREGAEPITPESLRDFCAGRVAHFKIPRYVYIADEFPMTITGKVRKIEMRERSVEILGLQHAAAVKNA
jgi:fatty-acyl-CoA synthase